MKKFKVNWLERKIIEYAHEVEVEVADDFVVNDSNLINVAIDSQIPKSCIFTNYIEIKCYVKNGVLAIPDVEIDSYEEILPPPPKDKKKEYLNEIERLSSIIADTITAKERVKEQLKQLQ